MVSGSRSSADVIVIGDGLIGLSTALELGRAGARCVVIGARREGMASIAAAGLLLPSVGDLPARVRPFFMASLDAYPAFVERVRAYDPTLAIIEGLIEKTANGERLHPRDGAIDNVRLVAAVRRATEASATITFVGDLAASVEEHGDGIAVLTQSGARFDGRFAVLAAGAWSPEIRGLPRRLPVIPLKGQMVALGASPLRQAVMGDDVYLVPRGAETLAGATVEHAGFDTTVTTAATQKLRDAAVALCPQLGPALVTRAWAGIRPATPDMLPIIGAEPDMPRLLYACGHSKNGILLAPATAQAISALAQEAQLKHDLEPFRVGRFPVE